MKNLSINLKNLLLNAKLSENELARRTGVSQQVINRILSGENTNPKIATLSPLANYFMISISQLIGEEAFSSTETKLNSNHLGWQEIPLIDWSMLTKQTLHELLVSQNSKLLIDIQPSKNMCAIKNHGHAMEPKFSEGTLLIFDLDKCPVNGDFILLVLPNDEVIVRQFFIKNGNTYKKCLNPACDDYKLTPIHENSNCIGTLIQSRTDYVIR